MDDNANISCGVSLAVKCISFGLEADGTLGVPEDGADDFFVNTQVFIGTDDDDAADSFDVVVMSPNRLAAHYSATRWTTDALERE